MKWISALCLISFFLRLIAYPGYVADYYINYQSYLENCENKDQPRMQCNGRCLLMEKLNQSDEHNSQSEQPLKPLSIELFLMNADDFRTFHIVVEAASGALVSQLQSQDVLLSIFHPPKYSPTGF